MKQVILVRKDLKLPKGKMAAQVAHAAVEASIKSSPAKIRLWQMDGAKKVVLAVQDEKELFKYIADARAARFVTAVITDAGKTVVAPGTVTCAAIGPDEESKIDTVTGKLKVI